MIVLSPISTPNVLFEQLTEASFTYLDMDAAYQDGIEDLADKVIELIHQSDGEISLDELIDFVENEREAA